MANDSGVEGIDDLVERINGLADYLQSGGRSIDKKSVDEMVRLARQRVPERTGLLLNGITAEYDGDEMIFQASARRVSSSGKEEEDYAHFVEFGTAAGVRGERIVAGDAFFAGSGRGRNRKQYRTHPGTPAQPFFYNSAAEVLEQRAREFDEFLGAAGAKFGFD